MNISALIWLSVECFKIKYDLKSLSMICIGTTQTFNVIAGFPMGEKESKAAKVIKILDDEEMEGMRTVGRVSLYKISCALYNEEIRDSGWSGLICCVKKEILITCTIISVLVIENKSTNGILSVTSHLSV